MYNVVLYVDIFIPNLSDPRGDLSELGVSRPAGRLLWIEPDQALWATCLFKLCAADSGPQRGWLRSRWRWLCGVWSLICSTGNKYWLFERAFLKDRIERKFSCRSIHPQLIVMPMIICFFCFLKAVTRGNSLDCSGYCLGPFKSRGNSWGAWNAWILSHTYLNVCAWGVPLCELLLCVLLGYMISESYMQHR